jgi:pSer/pThr/pTyr-binding forkhead associated (FHA) protein
MRIIIEIIEGPMIGRRFAFRAPMTVTIGRTERSDYVLEADLQISSLHLQLECEGNTCLLRDMNSSNGTWVNGQRVSKIQLQDADLVRVGQTTLRVRFDGQANGSPDLPGAAAESPRTRETMSQAMAETATDPARAPLRPAPLPPAPDSASFARSAASVALHIESAATRGRTAWIRPGQQLTIGRSEQSDIIIAHDSELSPNHFAVAFDGVRCELRDLESLQGVEVNGVLVRAAELQDGDEIRAGQTRFRVAYGRAPTVRPLP